MSETKLAPALAIAEAPMLSVVSAEGRRWLNVLRSPLWICLLIAILSRVWLIIHTNGVMSGEEAVVGLQAEHILRGEHPVYYYGQAYMGSLEAYLAAFVFLFTGPAVWAMRLQTILMGVIMTCIAWRFAAALAERANLSPHLKTAFMTVAALVAAFPPLYDMIEEMRVTGGYMEAFIIMLWLLLCTYRLTQRWSQQASERELALRWAGIGFLVGLGLWIDPLISYACVAIAIWLVGYFLFELKRRGQSGGQSRLALLKEGMLCVSAVPLLLVGFLPGLIWGAHHHWQNITYLLHNVGGSSGNRLLNTAIVTGLYSYCLAPRAMGGSLPTQQDVTYANPHIVTFGLAVVTGALMLSLASFLFRRQTALASVRRLTSLPLLFFGCVSVIFCFASISTEAIAAGCGPTDGAGRYVVPLVDTLPFLVATLAIFPALLVRERRQSAQGDFNQQPSLKATFAGFPRLRWLQIGLLAVIVLYFGVQGIAYVQADPDYTFQAPGCVSRNPTHVEPIVSYLQREHIHYVWATGWVGDHITFNTDGAIIATNIRGRITADVQAVLHADRASIFVTVTHSDAHPAFLQALDANHVTYRIARFYSAPGVDVLVITPLNRTLSPFDLTYWSLFHRSFTGCFES